jgi:DNA-binding transcriptional MerR regulator
MKSIRLIKKVGLSLAICGMLVSHPSLLTAQEATTNQGAQAGEMGVSAPVGKEHHKNFRAELQKMHEQMERMHQEMTQELQKQLTALREHAKTMDGVSDEKQLLAEMKKHQQLTDTFLSTMVEQQEKMHAQMREHRQHMRGRMGEAKKTEGSGAGQTEGHEAHHLGE